MAGNVVGGGKDLIDDIAVGAGHLLGSKMNLKSSEKNPKESEEIDDTVFYNNSITKSLVTLRNRLELLL